MTTGGLRQPRAPRRVHAVKRILFVCSGNMDRSPTAAALLSGDARFEVKSAGTLASAPTVVSQPLIEWADTIFVMEDRHRDALTQIDQRAAAKIIVLDIPDQYVKEDPALITILKARLTRYLGGV
jgi:predicted protein tyrosine phosphatase